MRYSALFLFITICSFSFSQTRIKGHNIMISLDSLREEKSFFLFKDFYDENRTLLNETSRLKYEAHINSLFGAYKVSNKKIDTILNQYANNLIDEEKRQMLMTRLSNSIKLYDYKTAYETSKEVTKKFKYLFPSRRLWEMNNSNKIWKSLQNQKKQSIHITEDTTIDIDVNQFGIKNIAVSHLGEAYPFVFDTGANLSVIIESQAKEMGLEIIDANVKVNSISGTKVNAQLCVVKELKINSIKFFNVVFLVFPDEALFFSQINYQIKGVLGYSIISALKEVHFLKDNKLFVPKEPSKSDVESNLAIEYLTPYINLVVDGKSIYFSLDTGAVVTFLYPKFYDKFTSKISKTAKLQKMQFAGAGGAKEQMGYKIDCSICYKTECTDLKDVALFPDSVDNKDEKTYGNLGQDYMSKFQKMIINFDKMFVHFE